MLSIRYNRVGKRNNAQFRIVVQEHTIAPGGRHVEVLGSYNPHSKEAVLKEDRVKYWLERGAQASDSVYNLLVGKGVIDGKKRPVKMRKKKKEGEADSASTSAETTAEKEAQTEVVNEEKPAEVEKEAAPAEDKPAEKAADDKPVETPARNASDSDAGGEKVKEEAKKEESKESASAKATAGREAPKEEKK